MRANCCEMPRPARQREAKLYRSIRDVMIRSHCEAARGHQCCGAITITRDTITLNCKLCGDLRRTIDHEAKRRERA